MAWASRYNWLVNPVFEVREVRCGLHLQGRWRGVTETSDKKKFHHWLMPPMATLF